MADVQYVTVTLSDGTPVQVVAGTPLHDWYLALAARTSTVTATSPDIDLRTLRPMAWFMTPHGPQSVIEPATLAEFRRRDYAEITAQQAADYFAGAADIPDVSFVTGQELPAAMAQAVDDDNSAFSVELRAALAAAIAAEPTVSAAVAARLASEQLLPGQVVSSLPPSPEDGVYFLAPALAGARYETSFEEYALGAPAGWSTPWVADASWSIIDSSGKRLRHAPAAATIVRRMLVWDDVDDADRADFDIVSRVRHGAMTETSTLLLAGRVSGAAGSENAYVAGIRPYPSEARLRIAKYVGGVNTLLGEVPLGFAITTSTEFYVRFRGNEGALSAKAWLPGSEPLSWHLERTDTALTAAGGVGVFSTANSSTYDWLDFSVATGGRQGRALA